MGKIHIILKIKLGVHHIYFLHRQITLSNKNFYTLKFKAGNIIFPFTGKQYPVQDILIKLIKLFMMDSVIRLDDSGSGGESGGDKSRLLFTIHMHSHVATYHKTAFIVAVGVAKYHRNRKCFLFCRAIFYIYNLDVHFLGSLARHHYLSSRHAHIFRGGI